MSTMKWIGQNLGIGGLVRNAGNGLGTVTKVAVHGAGGAASMLSHDPATKKRIKDASLNVGNALDSAFTKGGAVTGNGIDYGVQKVGVVTGHAAGSAAKLLGASEQNVVLVQKIGTVAGAFGVGVIAGAGIAGFAAGLGAAAGTAGAAATTSGLASLGAGSMAAGQFATEVITALGGASGVATLATTARQGVESDGSTSGDPEG